MKTFLFIYFLLGLFIAACLIDSYVQSSTKKHTASTIRLAFAVVAASWPYWAWRLLK